jgi:hypothetical protein
MIVTNIKKKIVSVINRKQNEEEYMYDVWKYPKKEITISGIAILQSIFGQCYIQRIEYECARPYILDKKTFCMDNIKGINDYHKFIHTFVDEKVVYENIEDYQIYCNLYIYSLTLFNNNPYLRLCKDKAGYRVESDHIASTFIYT